MTVEKTAFDRWATAFLGDLNGKKPLPPLKDQKPPTAFVIAHIQGLFGIEPADFMRRHRNGNPPSRYGLQVKSYAIWLASEVTGDSLNEIAKAFGYQDHTSVIYHRRRVRAQVKTGYDRERLEEAREMLRRSWIKFVENGAS